MIEAKICTESKLLDATTAEEVIKQLKTNPEVCEKCTIKPCRLVMYVFGATANHDMR